MILALILLGVQVWGRGRGDDDNLSGENGFFKLEYGDEYSSLNIYKASAWHANYVVPSNNYSPGELLHVYFSLGDSSPDINNSYAEFTHPDQDGYTECDITDLDDGDWMAECDISDLTTAGTYGPISLVIRSSLDNQIIAEDVAFGYFALLGSEPEDGDLTVTFYSEEEVTEYTVQDEDLVLQFDFTLDVDFYFSDYFVVTIDPAFTFDKLELEWVADFEGNEYFNETMINLYIDDEMNVYIYGFGGEITEEVDISFRLSGFTAPLIETTGNDFDFSLEVHRFGTNTIYMTYAGTGPADSIVAGDITIVSWLPVNSGISATTDLYDGLTTWFKLIVKPEHGIPTNGTIVFAFTGIEIDAKTYISDEDQLIQDAADSEAAAIFTDTSSLTCVADSAIQATCSASSDIPAGTNIAMYNLITISANLVIASVTTFSSEDVTIDEDTTGLTKTLPASGANELTPIYAKIATTKTDVTGVNAILSNSAFYGLLVGFKIPAVYTATSDSFTIYLPFTTGTASDDTKLVFATSATVKKVSQAAELVYATDTALTGADLADQLLGANLLSVPLVSTGTTVADYYFYAFIVSKVLETAKIYLPKVPTQMSQMAEIVLKLKIGTNYYVYASPLYFTSTVLSVIPTLTLACKNAVQAGLPARLTFTPVAYTAPTDYELKIELVISGINIYTDTNLEEDEIYPGTTDYKVTSDGKLYKSGLSSVAATDVALTIPLPIIAAAETLALTVNIYLTSGDDEILIFTKSSVDLLTTTTTGTAVFTIPATVSQVVGTSYELLVTTPKGYTDSDSLTTETLSTFYILLFPYGYSTVDADSDVKLTLTNSLFPYFYAYTTILAYVEGTGVVAGSTVSITIPWFEADTTVYLFSELGSLKTAFSNIECDIDSMVVTTASATSLTFVSYSPPTAKGFTYSNQDVDVTLSFTASRAILKGTVFSTVLDYWNSLCTPTFTIGGVTGATALANHATGTTINVKLTGCTLPVVASGATSLTNNGFTSVTGKYNTNTIFFWTEPDTKTQTVISSNTAISGKVSSAKLWVFPSVVGAEDVYFGISFTLESSIPYIPESSTIEIDGGFDDDTELEDNLWTNFAYSGASISSGVLTITNAEEIAAKSSLMIVKDLAFTLSTETPSAVKVTVTSGSVDIILDTSTTQKYSVEAEPKGAFDLEIEVSESSAGFVSEHNFTLTFDTLNDAEIFWVHLDATEYNSIAGPWFQFEDLPGILFLYAADSDDSFVSCITNHWVTSCVFDGPIEEDSVLSFSIMLQNAPETGSWGVFVTDDNLNYLYQAAYSSDLVFTNAIENDIDLYFAGADFSGNDDHYLHDLMLAAFVEVEATIGSSFTVVFPYPYDFSEYPSDTIPCSIVSYTVTSDGDDEVVSVLDTVDCLVSDNSVIFTLESAPTFTSDNWTYFIVYDVLTPELVNEGREDVYEYNPDENVYYSENFCILYATEDDGIVSASFDNLNSAFVGYTSSDLEALVVNGYKNLQVTPGTWSGPYQITNAEGRFGAESVEVVWSSYDDFIGLDEDSYMLDFIDDVAYFWLGVPSDNNGEYIEEGMYVITWEITETPFDGVDTYVYARPRNTLVEISYELVFSVVLNPPDIYVPLSGWSMPINLQFSMGEGRDISSFPYDSIEITFAENDTLGLTFRPNPLTLDMDVSAGFVSIKCTDCEDGLVYDLDVTVEGEDSSAFEMDQDSYTFMSGSRYDTPATFSIEITDVLASELTLSVQSNQIGVATWTIISMQSYEEDSNLTTYEYIIANSFILGAEKNSKDDLESLKDTHDAKLKELDDMYEDYEELTKKKLSLSRNIDYTAQSMILTEGLTELSQLTGLAPKTTYVIYLYFDNFDGNGGILANETVLTARTPSHAQLTFDFTSSTPDADEMKSYLKQIFGLPGANYNLDDFDSGRRLATSTSATVYSDTSSSTSAYSTALSSKSTLESSTGSEITITPIADDGEDAEFDGTTVWGTENGIYITLNYSSTVEGNIYCTVEANGSALTSDQVYESVNADAESVDQYYDSITAGENYLMINFTDEGYTTLGTYHVNCIVCNDFPGTPDCSDTVKHTEYEYTAEEDNTESSSGAEALVVAFAAYFLF